MDKEKSGNPAFIVLVAFRADGGEVRPKSSLKR
jgi:hypothetical protein